MLFAGGFARFIPFLSRSSHGEQVSASVRLLGLGLPGSVFEKISSVLGRYSEEEIPPSSHSESVTPKTVRLDTA
jgi:hypothetical protein